MAPCIGPVQILWQCTFPLLYCSEMMSVNDMPYHEISLLVTFCFFCKTVSSVDCILMHRSVQTFLPHHTVWGNYMSPQWQIKLYLISTNHRESLKVKGKRQLYTIIWNRIKSHRIKLCRNIDIAEMILNSSPSLLLHILGHDHATSDKTPIRGAGSIPLCDIFLTTCVVLFLFTHALIQITPSHYIHMYMVHAR